MDPARPNFKTVEVETPPVAPQASQSVQPPPEGETQIPVKGRPDHPIRRLLFLIPVVLIIGTIAAMTYLTNSNSRTRNLPTETQTPMPTLTPATPVPTPTPGPNSYSHPKFSFRYPQYLTLVECENSVHLDVPTDPKNPELDVDIQSFCDEDAASAAVISIEYAESLPLPAFDSEVETTEESIEIDGVSATRTLTDESITISFEFEELTFVVTLTNKDFGEDFGLIIESFKLKEEDPTKDWETFNNIIHNYDVSYPPDWTLIVEEGERGGIGDAIEIRKNADIFQLNNLVIETTAELENASFTASEIISSTRNLAGWTSGPKSDLRNIGGGNAQVVQGRLDGKWNAFVVIWYRNSVIQMTWSDSFDRAEQETFDNIISTFKFTK